MEQEDRRVLYEVLERVTSVDAKMDALSTWRDKHEQEDAETHADAAARIGKVEKKQTQLGAYYAAACVIIPVVLWALGWLVKASANAL
jgi:hypothetical protein